MIGRLAAIVAALLAPSVVVAFVLWRANPGDWTPDIRASVAIVGVALSIIAWAFHE
ncbi:hypothetical protein RCCRONUS_39 [Rhodobacter phage RcCronus]|uniref:Uncharacterized protein n=2 Tax=Cronusvirus cronus TaxID=2005060 RepID=A0A0K1Y717_9CAUD|nr:hypothetical protein FDI78_gp39 [Rhodobacter phage RcCronus]AKU43328.1 hypothetical protein RCCRONUS_39 [Rhodobacter phage RcCronus]AKY02708.1 hypothetical protein RCSAXON_41 [Rhodobacter phage RcSaxon]